MPITIPNEIPAAQTLEREGVFFMNQHRARTQDIRALRILIVNLMPTKITTETQLFRLLSNTPLQVEPYLLYTESYTPRHTSRTHLARFYNTFSEIQDERFDGMIITGAPVELMEYEEVAYWDELCRIMDWSNTHVWSTLYICWGAQAGLYHHYGIPKYKLGYKVFGVYEHTLAFTHPIRLFRGFDDRFYVPHSRYTEVREEDILACPDLELLSTSPDSGVMAARDTSGRRIFVTGHLEYDPMTLRQEYERDIAKGIDIQLPTNYYPDDDPTKPPIVRWRSAANLLFANWLNYYVYQETPYDLTRIAETSAAAGRGSP
ncbi:MAG: homoserine O-succinyltransferase [Bacillota bacterium]|nr:homoserine O-succinyltransferase [Bacillota bacterium]